MKLNKRNMFTVVSTTFLLGSGPLMALETVPDDVLVTGNATVSGNTTVNGTLTVQPAIITTVTNTPTPSGAGAADPDTGNFGTPTAGSTTVVTVLGGVDAVSTSNTGGGATIENNGNTLLSSATGTQTTGSYVRLTTVDIYNADQGANAGLPVPGSQKYYAAYPDPDNAGQFLPIGNAFTSLTDLDTFVANTAITDPVFAPLALTPTDLPATGGNLTVQGSTSTNGIDNNGKAITGVLAGVAADDAVNKGQLDAEAAARIADVDAEQARATAAEGLLDGKISAEEAARIAAVSAEEAARIAAVSAEEAARIADVDAEEARATAAEGVLDGKISAEEAARIADVDAEQARATAAEGVLDGKIATETTRATGAEGLLSGRINTEAAARITQDDILLDRIDAEQLARTTQDTAMRNEFRSADQALGKRIDTNTRGIAMVAAMTNTTVQPGMKQAVDVNMAQFEGETGFAFGYSYRVNQNLQIQGAGASTTDLEESVVRLGMSYQW
jgi:hypothetical protein